MRVRLHSERRDSSRTQKTSVSIEISQCKREGIRRGKGILRKKRKVKVGEEFFSILELITQRLTSMRWRTRRVLEVQLI